MNWRYYVCSYLLLVSGAITKGACLKVCKLLIMLKFIFKKTLVERRPVTFSLPYPVWSLDVYKKAIASGKNTVSVLVGEYTSDLSVMVH